VSVKRDLDYNQPVIYRYYPIEPRPVWGSLSFSRSPQ